MKVFYAIVLILLMVPRVFLEEDWDQRMKKLHCKENKCLFAVFATFDGELKYPLQKHLSLARKEQIKNISSILKSNPQSLTDTGITIGRDNFNFTCDSVEKNIFVGHSSTSGIVFANANDYVIVAITTDRNRLSDLRGNVTTLMC